MLKKMVLTLLVSGCAVVPQISKAGLFGYSLSDIFSSSLPNSKDPRVIGMVAVGFLSAWYGGEILSNLALGRGSYTVSESGLSNFAKKAGTSFMGGAFIVGGLGCILGSRHIVGASENLVNSWVKN